MGARFSPPVQTGPGVFPASCTMGTGSFPGVKRPGRGTDHPPPSSVPKGLSSLYIESLYLYSFPLLIWILKIHSALLLLSVCVMEIPSTSGQKSYLQIVCETMKIQSLSCSPYKCTLFVLIFKLSSSISKNQHMWQLFFNFSPS